MFSSASRSGLHDISAYLEEVGGPDPCGDGNPKLFRCGVSPGEDPDRRGELRLYISEFDSSDGRGRKSCGFADFRRADPHPPPEFP